MPPSHVLVTGATGFIGAHVVDVLLRRGLKVRAATRSRAKGDALLKARPQYASQLQVVVIEDFENGGNFHDAMTDIDGVIHVASPFTYNTTNNEKELIVPAINGVRAILEASSKSKVQRVVITSSFAAVMDVNRKAPPFFTYTAEDWNPLSYQEAVDPATSAVVAYRGSKKFAEMEAWDFVKERNSSFDVVTICPPMTFGPVAHSVKQVGDLNESNAMLWQVASGKTLPTARVPFWVDVRDLAESHVEALIRPEAGNKRFVVAAPEHFSYGLVAKIVSKKFDSLKEGVSKEEQTVDESHGLDGETAAEAFGIKYRRFEETVVDLVSQALEMEK